MQAYQPSTAMRSPAVPAPRGDRARRASRMALVVAAAVPLIATFAGVVGLGILVVGCLFNLVF